MSLITMDYFQAGQKHYHIYQISGSITAEQPHSHDYYQVCYVVKGQITHTQQDQLVPLGQGDIFIIPPGISHSIHFASQRTQIYSLSFDEQLFSPGFSQSHAYQFLLKLQQANVDHSLRLRLVPNEEQRKTIVGILECLLREQQAQWPRQLTAAASLTSALLCVLAQCYYQQPQNQQAYKELNEGRRVMEDCISYIEGHYWEPISQRDLLRIFGLSRSAFCAMFPQCTGMSLKQYVNQKRIHRAQTMIREQPELSLQQIAGAVGYGEASTFYRNFIQITGITPSEYRALYR